MICPNCGKPCTVIVAEHLKVKVTPLSSFNPNDLPEATKCLDCDYREDAVTFPQG